MRYIIIATELANVSILNMTTTRSLSHITEYNGKVILELSKDVPSYLVNHQIYSHAEVLEFIKHETGINN